MPCCSISKPCCEVPLRKPGDDRAEVGQPVHRHDVNTKVWQYLPGRPKMCRGVARLHHCQPLTVDVDPIGCCRRHFVTVKCGICSGDDCPCVRVWRRLAGEVARVEFGERGVDVVRIE